jgi:hypothetical protein
MPSVGGAVPQSAWSPGRWHTDRCRRTPSAPSSTRSSGGIEDNSTRIESKLRMPIVNGVTLSLSLFDDDPRMKHTLCPPKTRTLRPRIPVAFTACCRTLFLPLAELIEGAKLRLTLRQHQDQARDARLKLDRRRRI